MGKNFNFLIHCPLTKRVRKLLFIRGEGGRKEKTTYTAVNSHQGNHKIRFAHPVIFLLSFCVCVLAFVPGKQNSHSLAARLSPNGRHSFQRKEETSIKDERRRGNPDIWGLSNGKYTWSVCSVLDRHACIYRYLPRIQSAFMHPDVFYTRLYFVGISGVSFLQRSFMHNTTGWPRICRL